MPDKPTEQEADDGSLKTPIRTQPLDEAQRAPWFEGPDVVTALRVFDGDLELELPRKGTCTLGGSRNCDLAVPGRGLSATHCLLERKGSRLRLYDEHSTNGTYFGGRRIDVIDLNPGDTFTADPVTFICMNEAMRTQRPVIADILGSNFAPSPDKVLVDATKYSNNLIITGETGCDMDRLAHAIHAVSLRRLRLPVEVSELPDERAKQREIINRGARSTLVINVDAFKVPLDPTFCSMVFSADYHIRMIVLAVTMDLARKLIPIENFEQLQHIWIRPLAMRPGDVPELLDKMLMERQASFRLADLTAVNQDSLCAYEWRDNFIGLRLAADRLAAISRIKGWEEMDWREKSAALGVPKTTLYTWFTNVGLTLPIIG